MPERTGPIDPIEPSAAVAEANRKSAQAVVAADEKEGQDFADAMRQMIAPPDTTAIRSRKDPDRMVWDFTAYDFLDPGMRTEMPTVNGSLQRQGRLTAVAGLFLVHSCTEYRIYQVRGYDLSNMTIVESTEGLIVIDPLACYETAQAALRLFRDKAQCGKEERPVRGLIYTHSHVDHFGGSRGLFHELGDPLEPKDVHVVAPEGFLEHAVSENIYAGPAMARRAQYMYAAQLDKSPTGQVGSGLGATISTGEVTLIPPTTYIGGLDRAPVPEDGWNQSAYVIPWRPGLYQLKLAGVQLIFQLTPGTEAPAEMNIYFPDARALCIAENATHTMHNILSLRGAQVRDAHAWSKYLTEAIQTFGKDTDVLFASHHWPMWRDERGNERILEFLGKQRDMYSYLNDQTLRMINAGHTGIEISEQLRTLPAGLNDHWYDQGYYGSMSHNLKAVYQRYMGWYDGNPAHLWELPPTKAGAGYVEAMGGAEAVVDMAQRAYDTDTPDGFRWAAELLNHVIFAAAAEDGSTLAEPQVTRARELQAKVLTQLGYGSANGTWRNAYLTGAQEVVSGPQPLITSQTSADLIRSTTLEQYFSALARSVDGPAAAAQHTGPIALNWVFIDDNTGAETGDKCTTTLRNGVLVFVEGGDRLLEAPHATIKLSRRTLNELAETPGFKRNFDQAVESKTITLEGENAQAAADAVFGTLTLPDPKFPIVTP
ncbi:alkyl/aryl-sulfatase [Streptomyces sp. XH2]|uniref:alkyl/aryl-sulfatase n=1 Tax=Streptomyces sp. XH2 TaxID=3412483 RepID=UPI003C7B32AB